MGFENSEINPMLTVNYYFNTCSPCIINCLFTQAPVTTT